MTMKHRLDQRSQAIQRRQQKYTPRVLTLAEKAKRRAANRLAAFHRRMNRRKR